MYIKTLTIQGFKSYRDQTHIEPFSPKHNVVVGRNGSGKSNFFAAIRFVLSDAYTAMTKEERQSLLHEGVSVAQTMSAYVEIIFDNSDNRFPTGREEVILRRTIGVKKDEYSLDKKSSSRADVMNLLESAGFSKANPYYIVPQGRITNLTNAKDGDRLYLLKEVAGTKVYEDRRSESVRIIEETDAKRNKVNELLDYINTRMEELEEEKEELKEYQEKDKDRRCLEYALYQRELEDVTEALEDLEEERATEVHNANERRERFSGREQNIHDIEKKISEAKHKQSTATLTRQGTQDELNDLMRQRKELELRVDDLRAADQRAGGKRAEYETELADVERQIRGKEQELAELMPQWDEQREKEAEQRKAIDATRARLNALFAKRGRQARYRTKAERDAFLRGDITSLESHRTAQQSALDGARTALQRAEAARGDLDGRLVQLDERAKESRVQVQKIGEQLARLNDERAKQTEQRKELWREDAKVNASKSHAADELKSAERALAGMMDKDTGMGLRAVDSIKQRLKLDGVYGPLYRLFEVSDARYNTAVELTAGNSLFHVVVNTDATASKVLDIMLKERTGRVTFMPLNRLHPKNPPLPAAQDAIPLLDKLRYDPAHARAFQQVFGKTCVCKDLTVAAAYVKSHNINTITLDGDKVDRKGALTGGYHDVRRSRIEGVRSVASWRKKFEEEDARYDEVKRTSNQLEQSITHLAGQIQVLTNQQLAARATRDSVAGEVDTLLREKERVEERIGRCQEDIVKLESEIEGLEARLEVQRQELQAPMAQGLSAEEEERIEEMQKELEGMQSELIELNQAKNQLGSRKNLIQVDINENLRRKRDELRMKIEALGEPEAGDATAGEDLEFHTRKLQALNASIESLSKRIRDNEKEIDAASKELRELRDQLQAVQTQQSEDSSSISKQQKNTERYMAKRNLLLGRKDECNRNIRDLGVLPEEAFEKYTKEKMDRLVKKLHSVKESLKKFAHVNKKAFEQYNNFTTQRDQLIERRDELDKSAESINELVENLDQRKDEAIERTFKQVARNFEEVFEKLVPAGRGKLIIQRRIDQDAVAEEEGDTQQSTVDNYTGVAIKVSFNSKVDEGLRIQQLSGGQKSLVALALVFAIQKCDPAPFYLFDEIDANLDAQYRTAVAAMIHELSESAQFITTTFRPEMLVKANKFYGVLFNNQKVSTIRTIQQAEAMEFVDQEAQAQ